VSVLVSVGFGNHCVLLLGRAHPLIGNRFLNQGLFAMLRFGAVCCKVPCPDFKSSASAIRHPGTGTTNLTNRNTYCNTAICIAGLYQMVLHRPVETTRTYQASGIESPEELLPSCPFYRGSAGKFRSANLSIALLRNPEVAREESEF